MCLQQSFIFEMRSANLGCRFDKAGDGDGAACSLQISGTLAFCISHRADFGSGLADDECIKCSSLFVPFLCSAAVCDHTVVRALFLLGLDSLGCIKGGLACGIEAEGNVNTVAGSCGNLTVSGNSSCDERGFNLVGACLVSSSVSRGLCNGDTVLEGMLFG